MKYIQYLFIICLHWFSFVSNQLPPVSIVDPDGNQLEILNYNVSVAVNGPFTLVENDILFLNPTGRSRIEVDAVVTRFAMEIFGSLMEGEVVDRRYAREIYTSILHQGRDPALLEHDQGNQFSVRIFPIFDEVRILLTYSTIIQVAQGQRKLTIDLEGLPQIPNFSFHSVIFPSPNQEFLVSSWLRNQNSPVISTVNDRTDEYDWYKVFGLSESIKNFIPENDVVIDFIQTLGTSGSNYVYPLYEYRMFSFIFENTNQSTVKDSSDYCSFFIDTSASIIAEESIRHQTIQAIVQKLDFDQICSKKLQFYVFDYGFEKILETTSESENRATIANDIIEILKNRTPLGSTKFESLFEFIGKESLNNLEDELFLLISDGIVTQGPTTATILGQKLVDSGWQDNDKFISLIIGEKYDITLLREISGFVNGRIIEFEFYDDINKFSNQVDLFWEKALLPKGASLKVDWGYFATEPNSEWIYPNVFTDVLHGDEILFFEKIKPDSTLSKYPILKDSTSDERYYLDTIITTSIFAPEFEPLIQRQAISYYLNYLKIRQEESTGEEKKQITESRIKISIDERVLIKETALIVLETENDYTRWNIDRRALNEILVVGETGIEILSSNREIAEDQSWFQPYDWEEDEVDTSDLSLELFDIDEDNDFGEQLASSSNSISPSWKMLIGFIVLFTIFSNDYFGVFGYDRWINPITPEDSDMQKLKEATEENPQDRVARSSYVQGLISREEYSTAKSVLIDWLYWDPQNPQVYEFLGHVEKMNDGTDPSRAYSSVGEIRPNDSYLLLRTGILFLKENNYEEAAFWLKQSLKQRDDNPNTYLWLCLAHWQNSSYIESIENLDIITLNSGTIGGGAIWQYSRWRSLPLVSSLKIAIIKDWINKQGADSVPASYKDQLDYLQSPINEYRVKDFEMLFILGWESDSDDVDLHVLNPDCESSQDIYCKPVIFSEGYSGCEASMYPLDFLTQGLGPEVVYAVEKGEGCWQIGAKYNRQGPFGTSRGAVAALIFDSDGIISSIQIEPYSLPSIGAVQTVLTIGECDSYCFGTSGLTGPAIAAIVVGCVIFVAGGILILSLHRQKYFAL